MEPLFDKGNDHTFILETIRMCQIQIVKSTSYFKRLLEEY